METQTVEWKRVWDEKYLKQICAFANSDGGVMKVGIDDDGTVVGVKDRNPSSLSLLGPGARRGAWRRRAYVTGARREHVRKGKAPTGRYARGAYPERAQDTGD